MKYSQAQLAILKADIQSANSDIQSLQEKKVNLEAKVRDLSDKKNKISADLTQKTESKKTLEQQLFQLRSEIEQAQTEKENLYKWLADHGAAFTTKQKQLKDEIENLKAESIELQSRNKKLKEDLLHEVNQRQSKLAELEAKTTLAKELSFLFQKETEEIHLARDMRAEELENMNYAVQDMRKEIDSLVKQRNSLLSVVEDIKRKEKDISIMHKRLSTEYVAAYKKYHKLD